MTNILSALKSFRVGGGGVCRIITSALVLFLLEFQTVKSILSTLKSFRVGGGGGGGGVCWIITSALVLFSIILSSVVRVESCLGQ